MGKIILTERQYRNLNQILIGKEDDSKKGRINEVAKTFTDFDGNSAILDSTKFTLSLKAMVDIEALTSEDDGKELQLMWNTVFTKKKGDNTLKSNNVKVNWVGDYTGSLMSSETGIVEYKCDSKKFRFTKYSNEYKLDSNFSWIQKGFDELCAMTGAAPVVAPVVAGGKTIKWDALEPAQIIGFQRWWWGTVESDMVMEPGGVEGDECKAKYKSALCGGKPCIKSQAVDGKLGPSTVKLTNMIENRPIFEKWWNTGNNSVEFGVLPKKCSSVEKGYEKPPKQNLDPVVGGGGTGRGGGGAPFSGQYADLV